MSIEPCPFCGHVGLDFTDGSTYRWGEASCSGCGATCGEVRREYPDEGKWHEDAIKEWNTRAKREWVGLTDEERHEIREWQRIQEELGPVWSPMMMYLYLAIEAKLKDKNT